MKLMKFLKLFDSNKYNKKQLELEIVLQNKLELLSNSTVNITIPTVFTVQKFYYGITYEDKWGIIIKNYYGEYHICLISGYPYFYTIPSHRDFIPKYENILKQGNAVFLPELSYPSLLMLDKIITNI